jgi:hypothetical protein
LSLIVIDREQREALRSFVLTALGLASDVDHMLRHGKTAEARRMRKQFEASLRLLDDLGWESDDPRQRFGLTMPSEELGGYLRELWELASGFLAEEILEAVNPSIPQAALAVKTCEQVLSELGREAPQPQS